MRQSPCTSTSGPAVSAREATRARRGVASIHSAPAAVASKSNRAEWGGGYERVGGHRHRVTERGRGVEPEFATDPDDASESAGERAAYRGVVTIGTRPDGRASSPL